MWIHRGISQKLLKSASEFPVLVLTGARQVGKSSLLKQLFPHHNYVTLDLPSVAHLAKFEPELFLKQHPAPVIIDEIQYAPELFRYLKIEVDKNREKKNANSMGHYLLTGSQRFELMKGVGETLAGRASVIELETLSLKEIIQSNHFSENNKIPKINYPEYLLRGGYPELYKNINIAPADFYSSYTVTYLERDVKDLVNVNSLRDFERFIRLCALRSSQILNKSDLARDVGISPSTAGEWISVLQTSGVIRLLEPWFSNKSKSIIKTPKMYFSDVGLLCFLLNIQTEAELLNYPQLGAVWETFVFSEIRKRLVFANDQCQIFYWRDRSKEVDFLLNKAGRFKLAEAKWTEYPDKKDSIGLRHAEKFLGSSLITHFSIISRTSQDFKTEDEVQITSPYSLLSVI